MLEIFNTLGPFFEDNYRRISVREYARIMKISPPNASKRLNLMVKEGLLTKEEDRRYLFFTANRDNSLFTKLQQTYYQYKLQPLIEQIQSETINPTIILFGSLAKAEAKKDSDIDLAIFTISKKNINLNRFEKKLKREIQILTFKDKTSLKENQELLNNILNGCILSGGW